MRCSTLRRLSLLCELRRRGTITAVAEALNYSPSAVSQQLSTWRRRPACDCWSPPAAGSGSPRKPCVLVEHAERLLAEVERAEAALARPLQDTGGTLRAAAFQTVVLALVPPTLRRLADEHPALRVEVTETEPEVALPALVSGQFDLVLGDEYPGHPLPPLLESERLDLFTDELRLRHSDVLGPRAPCPRSQPPVRGRASRLHVAPLVAAFSG